jgi:hypothetical protein
MREICTSGSVRGGGDNVPTYSAPLLAERHQVAEEGSSVAHANLVTEELEPTRCVQLLELAQEPSPEQLAEHANWQQESGAGRDPPFATE